MYILIRTLENEAVKAGDVLVVKADRTFGRIGAFHIGGGVAGYADEAQPDGCLDVWTMMSRIRDYRVLCTVAVRAGDTVILQTDSPVFARQPSFGRVEKAGYGLLLAK